MGIIISGGPRFQGIVSTYAFQHERMGKARNSLGLPLARGRALLFTSCGGATSATSLKLNCGWGLGKDIREFPTYVQLQEDVAIQVLPEKYRLRHGCMSTSKCNLEREYRDCIKSRRGRRGKTSHPAPRVSTLVPFILNVNCVPMYIRV